VRCSSSDDDDDDDNDDDYGDDIIIIIIIIYAIQFTREKQRTSITHELSPTGQA